MRRLNLNIVRIILPVRGFLFFLLPFLTLNPSFAGNPVKKAYTLVNNGHYALANVELEKILGKDSTNYAAHYFKAQIFYFGDNPRQNLDSASHHIQQSLKYYASNDNEKTRKKSLKLGIRGYTIQLLGNHISTAAYERADSLDKLWLWEQFIRNYAHSKYLNKAIERRNQKAFQEAKGIADYESFKEFLEKYPNAEQASEARKLYESLLFQKETEAGTWQTYEAFINAHPNSPYYDEAKEKYERLLYLEFTRDNKPASYALFIKQYPDNPYKGEAEDSIYNIVTRPNTVKALGTFVEAYSGNRNINLGWQRLYELYNVKRSAIVLERFEKQYPKFPFKNQLDKDIKLARMKMELFEKNGLFGFVDTITGDSVISAIYTDAYPFAEGLAAITKQNCDRACKWGYINKSGELVIKAQFDEVNDFNDGLALVGLGNCYETDCKYGFIDRNGKRVVPIAYDDAYPFSEGLALVAKEARGYGFVNPKGKVILPLKYEDGHPFSGGYAGVKINGFWGFIDKKGKVEITPRYTKVGQVSEELAAAADTSGKWGYIDMSGEFVIEPQFTYADPFKLGKAKVIVEELKQGLTISTEKYINTIGEFVEKED